MTAFKQLACWYLSEALLRLASFVVPRAAREEWLAEWRAELWYARETLLREAHSGAEVKLLQFCCGAFQDAACLREETAPRQQGALEGSAQRCLLCLLLVLSVTLVLAAIFPNVRSRFVPAHTQDAHSLVLIEDTLAAEHGRHTLPAEQFLTWRDRHQRIFQSFAFYKVREQALLKASQGRSRSVRVAYTTGNLFEVIGLSPSMGEMQQTASTAMPRVVLGKGLWTREFSSKPVVGSTIRLGSRLVSVQAVAPLVASSLPGSPDAWIVDPDGKSLSGQHGFVLGRVEPSFRRDTWGESWHMSAPLPDGSTTDFTCRSLQQQMYQPWDLYCFAVFLALLALPATTSLPLGEYRYGQSPHGKPRLRRWAFLAAKTVLVLAITYCSSIDLAFAQSHAAGTADSLQLVSAFVFCLGGLRWLLRDQRQRCPVCLGKLTHPARVGQPSRSFLAWNGTELICAGGHGLLHVPEITTSWFGTQRWLYLDPSWQVLFSEPSLVPTQYF